MKRFINDLKKYKNYIVYSTKSELKTEIINSYLGWIWMILEPLCFMLIYTFIAVVVFKSSVQYFPIFVFIGLAIWNFFNKMVNVSVKLVASNRDIVTKVYVPKFVLLLTKMGVNLFKMFVSFIIIIIFMIFYKVPISLNILWSIPIILTSIIFTFGVCSIVMHLGVFVEDLSNAEIQILACYMKCEWLNRSILTWERIKPQYEEKDFSEANMLDKLYSALEQELKEAKLKESIYDRSIDRKPFDYT